MNRQSDYSYAVGANEYRSRALCLRRAELCANIAADENERDPERAAMYRAWSDEWRREAEAAHS